MTLGGCTGLKSVSEGKHLFSGSSLKIDSSQLLSKPKATKRELEELITVKPNSKLLWMRPFLCFYGLIPEPKSETGFWHWMKYKFGQPPSYIEDINPSNLAITMENRLQNHGHFMARASYELTQRKRTARLTFKVVPGKPYILKTVNYPKGKPGITEDIYNTRAGSILKEGNTYELKDFENERLRIDGILKEKGYYYFNADYLLFTADTLTGSRQLNISLKLKPEIPLQATVRFTLKDIYVLDDYSLRDYHPDTTKIENYYYVSEKHLFNPKTILNSIFLEKDSLYSRNDYYNSIRHLMGLGVYKFATARFTVDDSFPQKMKVNLLLTPLHKLSLSAEMNATAKSTSFAGPGLKLNYKDRNFLKGAEQLAITLGGNFETQFKGTGKGQTSYQISLQASLTLPKFVPFSFGSETSKNAYPKTIFSSGIGFYTRVNLYELHSFNISLGYNWRTGERISHLLKPVDILYTRLANSTAEFEQYLQENPTVRRSFDNQFVLGGSYNFTYNDFDKRNAKHNFYLNETIDLSGNIASLLTSIGSAPVPTPENPHTLLGLAYSQYIRLRNEVRYFYHLNKTDLLGVRLIMGAGLPYTNSTTMPYNKQYFAGGPSSIRAFFSRSLGPGTYVIPDSLAIISIDQAGDINLETNVEYRFDIYKVFKGALFADAGNIWLVNNDPQRPGGQFNLNTFYRELAVGTGVGLRFDYSLIILRLDAAFPLRKPYLPEGERWVINKINFGSGYWRKDNIIWNIAIGYPF